jgi:hypothetical protein
MRFCINLKQPCDYVFFKFMDNTRSSITVVETSKVNRFCELLPPVLKPFPDFENVDFT